MQSASVTTMNDEAIKYLNPALSASARFFDELSRNDDELERFVVQTAELMTDFYKRLLAKDSAGTSQSLRAARLQMIEGKRNAAPYYWAPFVLVGDWR